MCSRPKMRNKIVNVWLEPKAFPENMAMAAVHRSAGSQYQNIIVFNDGWDGYKDCGLRILEFKLEVKIWIESLS